MSTNYVKSNLEELLKAKTDASALKITLFLASRCAKNFLLNAKLEAKTFTSDSMIEKHYPDMPAMSDRSSYQKWDPEKKEYVFDPTAQKNAAKEQAKTWLEGKQKDFIAAVEPFNDAFSTECTDMDTVKTALFDVYTAIETFESQTYSLEDVVKKMPFLRNLDAIAFAYDTELAEQGIPGICSLEFKDIEGGSVTVDEASIASSSYFWVSSTFLSACGQAIMENATGGIKGLVDSLSATGSWWGKALGNGYVTSKDSPEDLYTGAFPSKKYDSQQIKEENDEWYRRVYGITPEEAGKNLGADTNAAFVGAAVLGPAMVAIANSDEKDPVLSEKDADNLLEAAGSEKTSKEAQAEAAEVRQEQREKREAEEKATEEQPQEQLPQERQPQQQHPQQPSGGGNQGSRQPSPTSEDTTSFDPTEPVIDTGGRLTQTTTQTVGTIQRTPTTGDKVDSQALDAYYDRDMSTIESERADLLQLTESAYDGVDTDKFREALAKGGYSSEDINYIMEHKELGFTALVMATQNSALTSLSTDLATQQGLTNFTSAYSEGLRLEDLLNGKAQASLGVEMDPEVTSARSTITSTRNSYNESLTKANSSVSQAEADKAAMEKVKEKIIKKSGTDCSKWSDEEVDEYNKAVEKYNESNAKAQADVAEANKQKENLDKLEGEFEELKNKKYDEYMKEFQAAHGVETETLETTPTPTVDPGGQGTVTDPTGTGGSVDAGDDAILSTLGSGDGTLTVGDAEQVGGVTQVTDPTILGGGGQGTVVPEQPQSFDGSDQAILASLGGTDGALNIDGTGLSPGVPTGQPTMNLENPQYVGGNYNGGNNVRVNTGAFTETPTMGAGDDRVIPGLGLDIDMSFITGGNTNGISSPGTGLSSAPNNVSDAAILNSLNMSNGNISSGSANNQQPIDTPSINTMASSGFEQALSGFASEPEKESNRETPTPKKIEDSKPVEPQVTQESQMPQPEQGMEQPVNSGPQTVFENGITVEIGEDGSLRL